MSSGYIYLETHPEHTARIRLLQSEAKPTAEQASEGSSIRYIARYNNLFRGHQLVQSLLSREIIDADLGLFKSDLISTVAKIETAPLSSERIWLDPELQSSETEQLEQRIAAIKQRRQRIDMAWKAVGFAFVGLLALRALGGW